MTTITPYLLDAPLSRGRDLRADLLPIFTGGVALAAVCGFGIWFVSPPSPPAESSIVVARAAVERPPASAPARAVANPFGGLVEFAAPQPTLRRGDPNAYGSLVALLPRFAARRGGCGARRQPLARPGRRPARSARRPPSRRPPPCSMRRCRPGARSRASTIRRRCRRRARPNSPRSNRPRPTRRSAPAVRSAALAYAAPDTTNLATPAAPAKTSIFSIFSPQPTRPAGYDDHTAVYDITARALYMPDGTKIEAHSGLGEYMDDPNHVNEHLRGATPPDLYDLQPRESLFHGMAAIRLVPVGGEEAVYGRAGLLAHPFMMGDNGDSNGCVSIKDYDAFLKAFQDGKVTRLAVVAKL